MGEENSGNLVRKGLVQFIGALLAHSPLKGKDGRQIVAAALCEEAVKISMEEEKPDMFVARPVLRAASFILKSRIHEIREAEKETGGKCSSLLAKQAENYKRAVNVLESITEKAFEGGN